VQPPFENATALLDFLVRDEPERYVFRGQTRSYEGPMLVSGSRDRFIPFDSASKWSGVSESTSEIYDEVQARRKALSSILKGEVVDDGKTLWGLPEEAYQLGFREFYNQPSSQQGKDLGNILRESAIPGMGALLGNNLGILLCQQYGFTSTALDVSTDPFVAMFFATHQAPYYNSVADSPHLGAIYRWPRARAMIAKDILLPLESLDFESIPISLRTFINEEKNLNILKEQLLQLRGESEIFEKRMMVILSLGDSRSYSGLRFPVGAFDRSRMGRQSAALLWPEFQIVKALMPKNDNDLVALIGDMLKTHDGEVFFFHHTNTSLPERLNKFALWPSIKSGEDPSVMNLSLELQHDPIKFEDPYLEMMLRFFSSCSPCQLLMGELDEPGNIHSGRGIGIAHGVVDLGYLLHPSDAYRTAKRLKMASTYTPPPLLRYISAEHIESFRIAFAEAVSS
jgi:hypothetical protein